MAEDLNSYYDSDAHLLSIKFRPPRGKSSMLDALNGVIAEHLQRYPTYNTN